MLQRNGLARAVLCAGLLVAGAVCADTVTGNGERAWFWHKRDLAAMTRLTVQGLVHVTISSRGPAGSCHLERTRIDQNLTSHVDIAYRDGHLNIRLPGDAVPSDWVEVRMTCPALKRVVATDHSVVIWRTAGNKHLLVEADDALVSVIGDAARLDVTARNQAIVGLIGLAVTEGRVSVSSGAMGKLIRNDRIALDASSGGNLYVLDEQQAIGVREKVAPGVLRVNKRVYIKELTEAFYDKKNFEKASVRGRKS